MQDTFVVHLRKGNMRFHREMVVRPHQCRLDQEVPTILCHLLWWDARLLLSLHCDCISSYLMISKCSYQPEVSKYLRTRGLSAVSFGNSTECTLMRTYPCKNPSHIQNPDSSQRQLLIHFFRCDTSPLLAPLSRQSTNTAWQSAALREP